MDENPATARKGAILRKAIACVIYIVMLFDLLFEGRLSFRNTH